VDRGKAIGEIDALVRWQQDRKRWHQDKTRQKMAAETEAAPGAGTFKSSDFGLNESDLQEMQYESSDSEDEESEDDDLDPIAAERKRRAKKQGHLRRTAGEPTKPPVDEVLKMQSAFNAMLRQVLAG